jgi:probable rRNA maturation factor
MPTNLDIDYQCLVATKDTPSQADLKQWVSLVCQAHHPVATELTVRIVDRNESQLLNHTYRGKDKPTNVLSFPSELPDFIPSDLIGDLVVCHDVVVDEALAQQKNIGDHYAHLIIHGTLHLLGFDHIDDEDAQVMEGHEIALLAQLGIDDPYQCD